MKCYVVLLRNGKNIERRIVAASNLDAAGNIAVKRFGGTVLNVLRLG